ncbi:Oidioi.mRNA.OKI2018_I69.chr2.g4066.t1.cds [Oikopleura dioica]|uniref:Oidioi.mRNA.OKI2018_I69.chr2.g4066.t1.cds n=1 Tax=Oikopleura dioica TaxID=34765 RepID=A0ABN7T0E5_OIKDI|nr:Oidioi.mRNA.OKI2018_I69.chr2.g4066.t1.cds [Oikopleura dioica]
MFIFGGYSDPKKIAKITNCAIKEIGKRLTYSFVSTAGSLVTLEEVVEETILCNANEDPLKCESFDGQFLRQVSNTKIQHNSGCMARYHGQALIIGGQQTNTVEILEFSPYNIEKFRLLQDGGNVTDNEVIYSDFRLDAPIVFEAEIDFCLN